MELGWTVMLWFLYLELAVTVLLVFPMPSNVIRGYLIRGMSKVWTSSPYVAYTFGLFLVLDAWLLYQSMMFQYGPQHLHADKATIFRHQSHSYLTAFSIGLFFVIRRLIDLQTQLFEARTAEKQILQEKKDK